MALDQFHLIAVEQFRSIIIQYIHTVVSVIASQLNMDLAVPCPGQFQNRELKFSFLHFEDVWAPANDSEIPSLTGYPS